MARRSSLISILFVSLLLFVTSPTAFAQSERGFTLGAGAGFTQPTGRTSNDVNTGWNVDIRGGYNPNRYLGLDLDFTYNGWGLNSSALARFKEPGGSASIWSVTVNPVLRLAPRKRVDPYVTAGYGVYHRNLTLTTPTIVNTFVCDPFFGYCFPAAIGVNQVVASSSTYKGGFNVGGGLDFRLGESKLKVFAEARYEEMFTTHGSNLGYIPVTFGLRW